MYLYVDKNTQEVKCVSEKNVVNIKNTDVVEFNENIPKYPTNYKFINGYFVENTDKILSLSKQAKKQEIESSYNQAIQEPIQVTIGGSVYIFQADNKSQDILSKVIVSAPSTFTTNWLDINNVPVSVTLDDLKAIAQAILDRGQQLFAKKVQLKQQIEQATTKEEVEVIVW